jgi:hypothetical protein
MRKADVERLAEECRRTGGFGPVRLGVPRWHVAHHLGAPDGVRGESSEGGLPLIWYYRDVEFHFDSGSDASGRLHLIVRRPKAGEPEVLVSRSQDA